MKLAIFLAALLAFTVTAHALEESPLRLVRTTDALSPKEEEKLLEVPNSFEVHLFASEPMINKPVNMAFDEKGRMWVSSTVEYPHSAAKDRWSDPQGSHVADSRDAIKILEDTDGDGVADKMTVFADGLNIPTGVLPWHRPEDKAGCIAWSIPNIWYFADTTGKGVCDKREVLFGPLGYEKDTHGMCSSFRMGADGWVYATHGFNNTSHFKVLPQHFKPTSPGEKPDTLDLHSGNVLRFRPDGSHVEIWSWGQVNPFGLCWDPRGNLYSADCHSSPIYQLLHGAYYPSFGKPHDGLGYGPVMCEHSHGSTGIAGIVYICGGIWGPEWDDHMLLGNVVTSIINHDHITYTGATPKANEEPEFLESKDPWFRPVDLQLGPDNALYIADFYNKIIGHYELPLDDPRRDKQRGRIWRVAKKNIPYTARPSLPKPRQYEVADLRGPDAFVQLAASAYLQEHPVLENLPALLEVLAKTPVEDPQLRHGLRIAIRDHLKLPGAFKVKPAPELEEDFAVIALATPTAESAVFTLDRLKTRPELDHDVWLKSLSHIARNGDEATIDEAVKLAQKRHGDDTGLITALHNGQQERGAKPRPVLMAWAQELAEQILSAPALKTEPEWQNLPHPNRPPAENPWCQQERKCTDGQTTNVISSLNKDLKSPEKLTGILRSRSFAAPARLSFWICGHRGLPSEPANELNLARLVDAKTDAVLQQAWPPRSDICRRVDWDLSALAGKQVRFEIVDGDPGKSYAWLGVGRFEPVVLDAEHFKGEDATRKQLRQLAEMLSMGAPVALRDRLRPYLPVAPAAPAVVSPEERKRLDTLIAARAKAFAKAAPDAGKGALVFAANCAVCHQIKNQGGQIGPQLDGIGNRGVDRLMEDVLDPNRNVDAHFQLHVIKLLDDSEINGFVRGEVGQVFIVVDPAGQERRVSKNEIKEDKITGMSLMPPVFGQTIPEADFFNLMSYLLTKS